MQSMKKVAISLLYRDQRIKFSNLQSVTYKYIILDGNLSEAFG